MKKIFICDDSKSILEFVKSSLCHHEVLCCEDSENALEMIKNFNPDLIILDIMMPFKDGITLCKEINLFYNMKKRPPIVFLSACELIDQVKEAFESGGWDYLIKPVTTRELKEKIFNIFCKNKEEHNSSLECKINKLNCLVSLLDKNNN